MSEPAARPSLRERLTEKLPEILIEAASVVIALLLALALNGWNEDRQMRERANTARAAILAELRGNKQEIEEARPKLKEIVDRLTVAADDDAPEAPSSKSAASPEPPATPQRGGSASGAEHHELQVTLGISLLSAAAWHAALATQASQEIDFAWMTRVAKVYELQENYLRVQGVAVDQLTAIPADRSASEKQVAQSLVARMSALSQLADGLSKSYDDVLGSMHP